MKFTRSKNTKRFNFRVNRNTTSHHSGANTFTISSKDYSKIGVRGYSSGTTIPTTVTMTVKEAKAMQAFLNTHLVTESTNS